MRSEEEVKEALELMKTAMIIATLDPDPRMIGPIASGTEIIRWILGQPSELTQFIDQRREDKETDDLLIGRLRAARGQPS